MKYCEDCCRFDYGWCWLYNHCACLNDCACDDYMEFPNEIESQEGE